MGDEYFKTPAEGGSVNPRKQESDKHRRSQDDTDDQKKNKSDRDRGGSRRVTKTMQGSCRNTQAGAPLNKRKKKKRTANAKAKKKQGREKMREGDAVQSEQFQWKVIKLLGSGGFGDVYRVFKVDNPDTHEYAMKTEMTEGDKRLLRLKIEVTVLKQVCDTFKPADRSNFVEFVDRGITDKFKFLVMGLIGPSLEDIRRQYLVRNYSKPTAMNCAIQTLKPITQLHELGWLHRDIKPQNFAVGIEATEKVVYILDFGIARKFCDDNKEVKIPRKKVKFLGTIRFASRACHEGVEQDRKDDLETWLYMVYDLFDDANGLSWKRCCDRNEVLKLKKQLFTKPTNKTYKVIPSEFKNMATYLNDLKYGQNPDYQYLSQMLTFITEKNRIKIDRKLDWIGKLKKKKEASESQSSTDNQQSGSNTDSNTTDNKSRRKRR